MDEVSKFDAVYWVCVAIIVATVVGLAASLRKMTIELVHPSPWKLKSHWWRFVLPPAVALVLALAADASMSLLGRAVWILVLGITLPLWLIFSTLQEVLVRRWERILGIATLLLILNTAYLTVEWAQTRREQMDGYRGPAQIVDYYSNGGSSEYRQNSMKLQVEWSCYDSDGSQQYYCHDNVVLDCNSELTQQDLRSDRDYDMTIYNGYSFQDCQNGFDQDTWKKYNWYHWNDDDDDADGKDRKLEEEGNKDNKEGEENNKEGEEGNDENKEGENENREDEEDNKEQEEEENHDEENKEEEEEKEEEENRNEGQEEDENNRDEDQEDDDNEYQEENNDDYQTQRPYVMIYGNCNTCQVDKHSAGHLFKATRNRLIIPLWILTSLSAIVASYFYMIRRPTKTEMNAEKTAQLFDNGEAEAFEKDEPDRCMA